MNFGEAGVSPSLTIALILLQSTLHLPNFHTKPWLLLLFMYFMSLLMSTLEEGTEPMISVFLLILSASMISHYHNVNDKLYQFL